MLLYIFPYLEEMHNLLLKKKHNKEAFRIKICAKRYSIYNDIR
jgi:hypothetical protein